MRIAEFDPGELLRVLQARAVDYIVIGGQAALARGAPILTRDLDITPAPDAENLERLAEALHDVDARLRTSSDTDGIPLPVDRAMLKTATSWTLTTRVGELDVMFTPAGTGGYGDLKRDADLLDLGDGLVVLVASLRDVIRSKEAAGREKDIAQLPILRRTLEEIRASRDD